MTGIPTVSIGGVPDPLPEGLHVLDVREDVEWRTGHIEGATHIPLRELPGRLADVPDGQTLVVCKVGGRSAQAVAYLQPAGPRRGQPRRRDARLGGRRPADGQRDRRPTRRSSERGPGQRNGARQRDVGGAPQHREVRRARAP